MYNTMRALTPDLAALQGPQRTSGLLAPIMLLTGHAGEVLTVKFNPAGDVVASGSGDKHIFLWRTYGECENFMMVKGAHRPRQHVHPPGCCLSALLYLLHLQDYKCAEPSGVPLVCSCALMPIVGGLLRIASSLSC